MSQVSKSKGKTAVYSLQFNDGDNFELVPHEPPEEDVDLDDTEMQIETTEPAVKEIVEHVCGICGKAYISFYTLKNHMKTCTKKDTFIDESYEEFTLEEIETMQSTLRELEDRNTCYCCEENLDTAHSGHIRCQDCHKSFKNVNSFRRHVSFLHSSLANARACNVCNAKCPTQLILDVHLEAHKKGKPFACQKCGVEFTRRYHLKRHQQYSNCDPSKQKPPNKCNVCGKEFFRLDNLRSHLRQHIGEQPKTRDYSCPYCAKSFMGTTTLNVHIRTHTGEKPFTCDVCCKGFPSNGALRKHRRSHTGEKPFQCSLCLRAFAAKEVLNRHMKTHTGVRPYVCTECGKGFIQATQLKAHMFHHTGENGFKCGKCDVQCNRKKNLNEHIEDFHCTDENVFDCKVCQLGYNEKSELVSHMKDVHKKKLCKCRACGKKFLDLKTHTECTQENLYKQRENIVNPNTWPLKDISIIDDQQDSQSSHEAERPRRLKILTSKRKTKNTQTGPVVEVIAQKISLSNARVTRATRAATNRRLAEETSIRDKQQEDNRKVKEEVEEGEGELKEKPIKIENAVRLDDRDEVEGGRLDDEKLKECVGQLLNLLLDSELLTGFGWPKAPIEHVLSSVIKQCGHEPADSANFSDYSTKIRENVKLLFTVVVENDSFKELLNNYTIDEVVLHILKMTSS